MADLFQNLMRLVVRKGYNRMSHIWILD